MAQLSTNIDYLLPAGVIVPFAGTTAYALPDGWAYCNGASLSTTTYAKLFATIGYSYGGSGGSFSLPNLNGLGAFVRAGSAPSGLITLNGDTTKSSALSIASNAADNHTHGAAFNTGSTSHGHADSFSFSADSGGSHTHNTNSVGDTNHAHSVTINSGGTHTHYVYINTGALISGGGSSSVVMTPYIGSTTDLVVGGQGSHSHTGSSGFITVPHIHGTDSGTSHGHSCTKSGAVTAEASHVHSVGITSNSVTHTHSISGGSAETAPKNMVLQYIIKL